MAESGGEKMNCYLTKGMVLDYQYFTENNCYQKSFDTT